MPDFNNVKKVHFIGLGGIGVSAIAHLMLAQNKVVSGSDVAVSEITEELAERGVKFFNSHQAANLAEDVDLVIYSPAVPEDNPERARAKELNIRQLSYPEFLGELSQDKYTIAVSGTDGKSTTTAMLGLILERANLDPTVIVGSKVKSFPDDNLRVGQSQYLVVEACEYKAAMLNIKPKIILLTNLRPEHLDYYGDFENLKKTFQQYVDQLPAAGILIVNADDGGVNDLITDKKRITYGFKAGDLRAVDYEIKNQTQLFKVNWQGNALGEFKLIIPGQFNVYNALGAIAVALELGIKPDIIKETLAEFPGIWRRFEKVGENVISDYGHTPVAVQATIKAAKEFYPDKRLVVAFMPHHHNRTKKFFNEFVESFDLADLIIINEIFDVAGREAIQDQDVSARDLVEAIKKRGKEVIYSSNLTETEKLVSENKKENDLVVFMGAGDIYKIAH
ncbi:MAG: UDP-N-acetylmuramate--L-alanine ligase [bacterium]